MSKLQDLGKRLDDILIIIKKDHPSLESKFIEYIVSRFNLLINSDTDGELENKIIQSLNGWLDMLEMELKGLFEEKI